MTPTSSMNTDDTAVEYLTSASTAPLSRPHSVAPTAEPYESVPAIPGVGCERPIRCEFRGSSQHFVECL
jgi:hypothetical protein